MLRFDADRARPVVLEGVQRGLRRAGAPRGEDDRGVGGGVERRQRARRRGCQRPPSPASSPAASMTSIPAGGVRQAAAAGDQPPAADALEQAGHAAAGSRVLSGTATAPARSSESSSDRVARGREGAAARRARRRATPAARSRRPARSRRSEPLEFARSVDRSASGAARRRDARRRGRPAPGRPACAPPGSRAGTGAGGAARSAQDTGPLQVEIPGPEREPPRVDAAARRSASGARPRSSAKAADGAEPVGGLVRRAPRRTRHPAPGRPRRGRRR